MMNGKTGETTLSSDQLLSEHIKSSRRSVKKWLGASVLSVGCMVGGFSTAFLTHGNSPQQNAEITACDQDATTLIAQKNCASEFGNNGGDTEMLETILGIVGFAGTTLSLSMAHDAAVKAGSIPSGVPLRHSTGI